MPGEQAAAKSAQRSIQGNRVVRSLLSVYGWLSIFTIAIVGFFIEVVLALVTWPFDRRRLVTGRFFRLMAVAATKASPFWSFHIHGELPKRRPDRVVFISNHVSNADAFLICHLPWEMKWLGKAELFWVPFIGWCMWFAGDIPVRRGKQSSRKEAMALCAEWVKRGVPVMIFPEGTRSPDGELLPFKDGAFRLAIETGADLMPLAVTGTREALPKHSWMFGFSRGLVTVGEPISTAGMTLDDVDRLKAIARERIEDLKRRLASV